MSMRIASKTVSTSAKALGAHAVGLRRIGRALLLALACGLVSVFPAMPVAAQKATDSAPLRFESTVEEKRFHALTAELRCVMCQNQSLADSNAQIAVDLRREVLSLIREGRSDSEIRDHLVARYGEFVLYRPRLQAATWLLWFGPLLFLLIGAAVMLMVLRHGRGKTSAPTINDDPDQEW